MSQKQPAKPDLIVEMAQLVVEMNNFLMRIPVKGDDCHVVSDLSRFAKKCINRFNDEQSAKKPL